MSHIFISYYHEDNDFAENLIHNLHNAGFTTWRDRDELFAGEVWRVDIDQAIKDAVAMIVIMTPDAKKSEYVTYEWAFAFGVGVKIIPVMLQETKLHPRLEDIQYLDFTSKYRPWQKLIETVHAIVSNKRHPFLIPQNTPPYIKNSIDALDSPNASDREGAINILIKDRGHPVVQKALIMALEHDLREVRIQTSLSIAKFPDIPSQALRGLFEAMRIQQYNAKATEALGKMGKIAIPELLGALDDKDVRVRRSAIQALGMIGDIAIVPNLLQLLNETSESDEIHDSVIFSLGRIRTEASVLGLLDFMHREKEALNELTETLQKLAHATFETEQDFNEQVIYREHEVETMNGRIQYIVGILCGLPDDTKPILMNNLHTKDCESCSELFKELKTPSKR